jgi:MipA family protein
MPHSKYRLDISTCIFVAALSAVPLMALAQTAPSTEPTQPLWEIGVGAVAASQPAYPGAATNTSRAIALPFFIYRGEVVRAEQGNVGLRALKTPRYELDVGFSASLGSSANDVPERVGMRDIGTLVEFGPRLKINLGDISKGPSGVRLDLPVRGVFDLSNSFANRGISFEPQLSFDVPLPGGWRGGVGLSALFGTQKLNETFYTVTAAEALANRPAYTAEAGLLSTRVSFGASKKLTPDLRALGFVRLDSTAGSANSNSSLITRSAGASIGVGLAYTFGRSSSTGVE